MKAAQFFSGRGGDLDFASFHVVGHMVEARQAAQAYDVHTLYAAQAQAAGRAEPAYMPFTYPPPFALALGGVARLPLGWAYLLFTGTTLAAFLAVLRRVSGREGFAGALLIALPAAGINVAAGQTGLLAAALAGLAGIWLAEGRGRAGWPAGLMVLKPHLGVALAVQALAARRWGTAARAVGVAVTCSALATLALGWSVWPAFAEGVRQATALLRGGLYQFPRMVSAYASARSLGLPDLAALVLQAAVGLTALAGVARLAITGEARRAAGFGGLAAVMVSPYAYDYDLTLAAVGLAMLAPELGRAAKREAAAIYALVAFASLYGVAARALGDALHTMLTLSPGGVAVAAAAALAWRAVRPRGAGGSAGRRG